MNPAALPIDPRVLDEAADWLMQLHASDASEADRIACEQWRQRSPEHARAWERAELLMQKLGRLPAALAMPMLERPAASNRRAAVAKLAALLAAVPAGWGAWRLGEAQGWSADLHTAPGERRDVQLADGSRLTLNTDTAVDVRFDAAERFLRLRSGEILVQTARDLAVPPRAFRVATAEGRLEALGTRFSVRQAAGRTHLAVLEGAVRVEPIAGAPQVVQAGRQWHFGAEGGDAPVAADAAATAWTRGMLLADRMRLADVAAELSRYRRGLVQCDPAIAEVRVSGAFPVTDTDRALTMLVSTYPVDARVRLRGHWVTLGPRDPAP